MGKIDTPTKIVALMCFAAGVWIMCSTSQPGGVLSIAMHLMTWGMLIVIHGELVEARIKQGENREHGREADRTNPGG